MLDWLSAWYKKKNDREKKVIVFAAGLVIVMMLYYSGKYLLRFSGSDEGLFVEIIGILITVLLIERLRAIDDTKRYRQKLVHQARSKSNSNAIDAIDLIRYEKWLLKDESPQILSGTNLSGADLTGANLRKANLKATQFNDNARLDKADLRDALLRNASFVGAQLNETDFRGADLAGVIFSDATLSCCIFRADRDKSDETHATLYDEKEAMQVMFNNAKLIGCIRYDKDGNKIDRDFSDLKLNGANFDNASLENIHFKRAELVGCRFIRTSFTDVVFDESHLEETVFVSIDKDNRPRFKQVSSISFKSAHLNDADLRYLSFVDVDFTDAKLFDTKCQNASFSGGTKFQMANLTRALLTDTIFDNVQFDGRTVFGGTKFQDIYEAERKVDVDITEKQVEEAFKRRVEAIAKEYSVKRMVATISLDSYESRQIAHSETEDGELMYETVWVTNKEKPSITIDLKYYAPTEFVDRPDPAKSKLYDLLPEDDEF